MISRTAMVVLEVQKQVKSGKVLKGDFADAVNHARYAVQLFQSGKFRHAAMHAELARRLAVKASVANNGKLETTKISLNEEEKSVLFGPKVEDGELLYEVKKLLKLKPAVSEDNLVNSDLSDLTSAKLNTVLK